MKKKNKIKIAMLGHKHIPSREGGVEIVVEELSVRMAKKGYLVTCFNRSNHHVSGKEFDQKNIKEYRGVKLKKVFTVNIKGLAAMTSSFFAAMACGLGKYDIIHFHAEGPCAMLWIPKLRGKRCVATIHGLDWQRAKWGGFASKYIKFGEKMAVKYADEIIVLSHGTQEYFKEVYNRETNFIPNGVNKPTNRNPDLIKRKFDLDKDGYLLFLGRLVPEKGIEYLIKAFEKVNTEKKLVIAGGTSDSDDFIKKIKKLAQKDTRVLFTGFVQGALLDELYSNAYIYVLPSDLEGMPLSLLEAMSYGNCCVVSNIRECVEVVEDKAIVFEKGNSVDLKDKLQVLCDNEEIVESYKRKASEFICKKYNWDRIVDRTLEVYFGKKK